MAQTPLTEQTPVEIDTQLAEINQRAARPHMQRNSALNTIEQYHSEDNETRMPVYARVSEYARDNAEGRLVEAEIEIETLRVEAKPLHDEFRRRGGWPRYYHVTNTNGHVHSSLNCPSCFPDTQYAWRTDLSGLWAAQVVEREAYQACSVCMPIAPTEQKAAFKAHQQEKRETKQREREAKQAEKVARKLAREESLAHKANAALDKYGNHGNRKQAWYGLKQAWYDGKITDSVYDTLYDAGQADRKKY